MEKPSDEELLAKAKDYDEEAISKIYEKYHDYLFYYGLKVFKNEDDAEEVVAQTFERFLEFLPTIRGGSLKNWLVMTARSVISLISRDRERNFPRLEDPPEELFANPREESEGVARIRLALSRLPKRYQAVLNLFYAEGYSVKEIAEKLKKKERDVYLLLYRAKKRLKKILGGSDEK